jgi:ketosteroid isomerase-like protein
VPIDEKTIDAVAALFPEGDWIEALDDDEGEAKRLAALRRLATPDLEVAMIGPGGFSGTFHGVDGFEAAWRDWLQPFASYRVEREPELQIADEAIVFFGRQLVTAKGGVAPLSNDGASVFFLRGDKVRRIEFHLDRAAALRSAGLEP